MKNLINNGQPVQMWHGISAAALLRRCEQALPEEAAAMSTVASLMHAGEPISESEWMAAESAMHAVEKRLIENYTGEVKLNRYGQPHGGVHPALLQKPAGRRFATIEINSGYVWWVGDAADEAEACRKSDAEGGGQTEGQYHRIMSSEINNTDGGYAVYEAPAGFDVSDGQDEAEIAAVSALPLAGYYRVS